MIHDSDRRADAITVAKREYGDDEPTRELDLVIERPDERTVLIGEGASERPERGPRGRPVGDHAVEDLGATRPWTPAASRRIERGEYDPAIAIAERRCDDPDAVVGRGHRRGPYERWASACGVPGERGSEQRQRGVAESCERCGAAARGTRPPDGRDDVTDDLRVDGVGGATPSSAAARTDGSGSSRSATSTASIGRHDPAPPRRGRRPPIAGVGGPGEVARERPGGGGGSCVADRGELHERAYPNLRVRVLGDRAELDLRGR